MTNVADPEFRAMVRAHLERWRSHPPKDDYPPFPEEAVDLGRRLNCPVFVRRPARKEAS